MPQLDPFIIYTVKLAMDYQSVDEPTAAPPAAAPQDEKAMLVQQDTNNPMFPETLARIMTIKSFPLKANEKAPKLQRENILSLLYHADEQWVKSTRELNQSVKLLVEQDSHQYAVDHVHRQQRIFLDTCHILHKHLMDIPKKFNEPIWFAAQVLHKQCQIRHLEQFTSLLKPLASDVWMALEQLRRMIHRLIQKQHQHIAATATATSGFLGMFFFNADASTSFYSSTENHHLLQSLVPYLTAFEQCWSTFEKNLYECYVLTVFGKHDAELLQRNISHDIPLSPTLFSDALTQLLPLALDRAMDRQLLDVGAIQTLDPIAFVALPRLAILAGVTWLAHVTGWRTNNSKLPVWIQMHKETLDRIAAAFTRLEVDLLQTSSKEKHHDFVQLYKTLERALVDGCDDDRIKPIYVDICIVADSVLSSHLAQSFSMVLCHLFKHVGLQYDIEFEEEEDAVPIEQTLLDLAI